MADYQWLAGLAAGVFLTLTGNVVNHWLAGRREAAGRRRQALRAQYEAGKEGLNLYIRTGDSPYSDNLDEAEVYNLTQALTEPFGARFAEAVVHDFFDKTATPERFQTREKKMREQLAKWERELDIPPRIDLGSTPPKS